MNRGEGTRDDMRGASKKGSAHARVHLPIVLVGLLAACAGPVEVRYQSVEVPVPVVVACVVAVPEAPKWALEQLPVDADEFQIAKAMRADRVARDQYIRELTAAMAACKKGTP